MPAPSRIRTLTYRRAVWSGGPAPFSLHDFVRKASEIPDTQARTFSYKGTYLTGIAWRKQAGRTFGHIAQWDKDAPTSTVRDPSPRLLEAETLEQPPPAGQQYVGGDILFLATGNHLLICPSGAREAVIGYYLEEVAAFLGLSEFSRCSLEPVADLNKVKLIKQEGVKSLRLDSTLYEATMVYEDDQLNERRPSRAILTSIGKTLRDLLVEEANLPEIARDENLTIKLEISYDSRRRGGELGRARIEELAREVIEQEEDEGGFRIITGEGKTIRSTSLSIRQSVPLAVSGNTVQREAAWDALLEFHQELLRSGALET